MQIKICREGSNKIFLQTIVNEQPSTGDSGGPLECVNKVKQKYLCGVVSRGYGPPDCGEGGGVYVAMNTKKMIKWLKKTAHAEVLGPRSKVINPKRKKEEGWVKIA